MLAKYAFSGLRILFITIGVVGLLAAPQAIEKAAAEPRSVELEKVIEGAKKEGILKIQWTGGRLDGEAGLTPIVAAMNKKYGTNIKLQFTPSASFPKVLNKIIQEKAAGQPSSTDVNLMAATQATRATKVGILKKLDWGSILERPAPAGANFNRVAPGGDSVAIATSVSGITYNTNLVKGDDIPTGMEDVLKPKWKGKIASTPYATGLYQFAAKDMMGYKYMKRYTQRLANQIGGLISCSNVNRISSGEFAMLVFDCAAYDALRYQKRGAPVAQTTVKEIAGVMVLYLGVPVHAKHPNASTLFINFLHTREGQALQWKNGRHDLHIYPESHTREQIEKVVERGGKLAFYTVKRSLKLGQKEVRRVRGEFIKILKQASR